MKKFAIAVCLAFGVPAYVCAQEISLTLSPETDGLKRALRQASLTISLQQEGDADAQDIVAAARADYRRLLTALYANGYYGGTISIKLDGREAASILPLDAPDRVANIDINVAPGQLFAFGRVSISPTPPSTALPEALATGAPAQSEVIRSGVRTGVAAWRDIGHAMATPEAQAISANHANQTLDVDVTLNPGPRLTFGDLTVSGNDNVRTSAIKRIAGLPTGAVYSPLEIDKAAQRLRRAGAFDSATLIEAELIGTNDTLPLTALVSEAKPRRFGFGIELSTIEGLTVSSYWMHRNAFGGAERFRVDGEISGVGGETGGIDYQLSTSLKIPAIYGPDTDFLATAVLSREDEPEYLLDSFSAAASATRILRDDLTANIGVGILTAREQSAAGTREYTFLTLPLGLEYDRRDDPTNAKSGYYIDVDAMPFVGLRGGADGGRIYADARVYGSFGDDNRVTLAARGQVGSVIGATTDNAPADFLFYSGGGGTVRGQTYNALGVTDAGGTTGGTSFIGTQLEARVGITNDLSAVGFFDYGQVGATAVPGEGGAWHSGAGIGIRYDTGIGPIRLDVGTPANGPDAFGSVQVYIGIGQAF